jgi:alpha-L-fucosidase
VKELMTEYGRIDILWLDGGQVRPPKQDIHMDRLVAMARGYQPDLIVVNRAAHDAFEDYRTPEQEVPPAPLPYVWESCITMGTQWSYKPGDTYKSAPDLIRLLVDVVSKGGNLLLNIGPQPDGRLPREAVARLEEIGAWMAVNGQAIYGTRAVAPYNEGRFRFTKRGGEVYAIYVPDPTETGVPAELHLRAFRPARGSQVELLGASSPMRWQADSEGIRLTTPRDVFRGARVPAAIVFKLRL